MADDPAAGEWGVAVSSARWTSQDAHCSTATHWKGTVHTAARSAEGIIRVSDNTHALALWRGFTSCGSLSRLVYFTISMWGNLKLAYKYLEAWLPNGKDWEDCWLQILAILWPLDARRKPEGRGWRLRCAILSLVVSWICHYSASETTSIGEQFVLATDSECHS